jgi:hypothetical protein
MLPVYSRHTSRHTAVSAPADPSTAGTADEAGDSVELPDLQPGGPTGYTGITVRRPIRVRARSRALTYAHVRSRIGVSRQRARE